MAPSVAETRLETVVPVKASLASTDDKPKVRRAIDEEGGQTTASVRRHISFSISQVANHTHNHSTRTTSQRGTTARNTHPLSPSPTSITAKTPIPPSKTSSQKDPPSKSSLPPSAPR